MRCAFSFFFFFIFFFSSLFSLFFLPSVKRLKKKELKEEKLVGRIISVPSSKAFTLGGKLEKCYLPASNGTFEFSFRFHFGSRSFHFYAECREPTCSGKNTYPKRCWPCCIGQAEGISNFPEWVVPVEAFWRNRYREDEVKR